MSSIERSIDINAPVARTYEQLCKVEEFPRFMQGVHSVHALDDMHLHWSARVGERDLEWDCEITERVPERFIAWRSIGEPRGEGRLTLEALGAHTTRVTLHVQSGDDADSGLPDIEGDLARLKKIIEGQARDRVAQDGDLASAPALAEQPGAAVAADAEVADAEEGDAAHQEPPPAVESAPDAPANAQQARHAFAPEPAQDTQGEPVTVVRRIRAGNPAHPLLPTWEVWTWPALRVFGEQMEQAMSQWWRGYWWMMPTLMPYGSAWGMHAWTPSVDVTRDSNRLLVCAKLPGVEKENVQVELAGGNLLIRGEGAPERPGRARDARAAAPRNGRFFRAVALPIGIDAERAAAHMHDGMLEVSLPLVPKRRAHQRTAQPR